MHHSASKQNGLFSLVAKIHFSCVYARDFNSRKHFVDYFVCITVQHVKDTPLSDVFVSLFSCQRASFCRTFRQKYVRVQEKSRFFSGVGQARMLGYRCHLSELLTVCIREREYTRGPFISQVWGSKWPKARYWGGRFDSYQDPSGWDPPSFRT